MPEAISNTAAQKVTEQLLTTDQGGMAGEANPADLSRFQSAMGQSGPTDAGAVQSTTGVSESSTNGVTAAQNAAAQNAAAQNAAAPGAAGTEPPMSLGDAMLDGIEKIKATHDAQMTNVTARLQEVADQPMSVGAAMQLQFDLMQMTLQQDLTTKVADKASQGVQTLFKNQG